MRIPPDIGFHFNSGLHDLVLGKAGMSVSLHALRTRLLGLLLVHVLDKAQVERAATILVTLELGNGGLSVVIGIKSDDTRTSGATTGLILNLGLLDLTNRSKELDEIFVASGPGQLESG